MKTKITVLLIAFFLASAYFVNAQPAGAAYCAGGKLKQGMADFFM